MMNKNSKEANELRKKFEIVDLLLAASEFYQNKLLATIEMEQNASGFLVDFCSAYNLQ